MLWYKQPNLSRHTKYVYLRPSAFVNLITILYCTNFCLTWPENPIPGWFAHTFHYMPTLPSALSRDFQEHWFHYLGVNAYKLRLRLCWFNIVYWRFSRSSKSHIGLMAYRYDRSGVCPGILHISVIFPHNEALFVSLLIYNGCVETIYKHMSNDSLICKIDKYYRMNIVWFVRLTNILEWISMFIKKWLMPLNRYTLVFVRKLGYCQTNMQ